MLLRKASFKYELEHEKGVFLHRIIRSAGSLIQKCSGWITPVWSYR